MAARARIFDFDRADQLLSEAEPLPRRGSVLRASSHLITVDLPELSGAASGAWKPSPRAFG